MQSKEGRDVTERMRERADGATLEKIKKQRKCEI